MILFSVYRKWLVSDHVMILRHHHCYHHYQKKTSFWSSSPPDGKQRQLLRQLVPTVRGEHNKDLSWIDYKFIWWGWWDNIHESPSVRSKNNKQRITLSELCSHYIIYMMMMIYDNIHVSPRVRSKHNKEKTTLALRQLSHRHSDNGQWKLQINNKHL